MLVLIRRVGWLQPETRGGRGEGRAQSAEPQPGLTYLRTPKQTTTIQSLNIDWTRARSTCGLRGCY